ncbi:MAG: vWA domain-containing protein [Clostridium sp.]
MKGRLTKLLTTFLAVVLLVGMSPAAATTAYAASWNSGGKSISNWWNNWFGSSNKNDSSNKNEQNDAVSSNSNTVDLQEKDGSGSSDGQLSLTKTITHKDGDNYTIRLEAYATGEVKTETQVSDVPTDIVLVLDQSGSMTTKMNNSNKTRLQALQDAANTFVSEVQKKAAKSDATYRVAVVGFGTGSYVKQNNQGHRAYENTELFIGSNQYNYNDTQTSSMYGQAFQDMNTKAGQDNISASINSLAASGATCADLGMDMANKIFAKYPLQANEKRNRIVVMFTDGSPSKWSDFSNEVANNTIAQSSTSKKTYNASVYTLGVLDGADPSDTSSSINKYMNYVSSNFPDATSLNNGGTGDTSKGFYKKADNAAELKDAFESISSSIESGSTTVTLNQNSVLRDVISDDFSLPANADKNSIVVKTADYAGKDSDGTLKWTDESTFGDAKVSISGKTINVSNFNYKDLYAATVNNVNQGKKLIVEIPVTINRSFGANNVLSNASAGIYPLADSKDPYITVESPEGSHPTEYGVEGTEQWIDENTSATIESLIGYAKDGDFEYKPDGVKNKYVDIVYTIKDKDGNTVGTYTVEHGKTTGTASPANTPKLNVDTVYDVEVTVTPIVGATDADKACGRQAETKTYKTESHVYIKGVDKAFVIDFGKPVTYTKDQVFSKNQLVKESEISIKDASNTYGNLTLNNDKSITYKLNKFMNGIDTYVFNVACKAPTQTVKMVPASSVYYEDNFGEETDAEGNVTTKSIIDYDDNWTTVKDGNVVTSINGDDPVGYDSAYEGNTKFSSGSARMAKATTKTIKATFKFTGSGIDLYGYTDNNTGRMRIQLYKLDSNDKRISNTANYTAIVDTKYNSGKVYQTPLFSYKGEESERYEVVVTVGKGSTIYLDALRVYYPIGKTNENYKDDENNIEYVDIRDQIFNPEYFSVSGKLFVDEHADGHNTKPAHIIDLSKADDKTEYSIYGRKREVAIAPGGTVTLSGFKQGISVKQIGMRTNAVAPEKFQLTNPKDTVDINGKEINLTSATDMYYNVTVNKNGELVITNNTNYIITLTNLKLK